VALLWDENIFWLVMSVIIRSCAIVQIPFIEAGELCCQVKQDSGGKDLAYRTPFGKQTLNQ